MHESLSIWSLILGATAVVQFVMFVLVGASLTSWVMIFQRFLDLRSVQSEIAAFEDEFWSGTDLREIHSEIQQREDGGVSGIESMFVAGFREFTRLSRQDHVDSDAVMQGVQRVVRVALQREEERLETHLSFLATVGSTSPYIGLFGTVWGIMNSFRNLASVGQATLATVAPGISEALIATAMGLVAAIPAVIAYNRFSSQVETLMKRYLAFSDEFASVLHRALHARVRSEG